MRDEVSNAEVDRILQEIHTKQSAQAVSNTLVGEVLQSIQKAEGTSTDNAVTTPVNQSSKPKKKKKPSTSIPKQQAEPQPKQEQPKQEEAKQQPPVDTTQEFQFNVHLDGDTPPENGKGVVVDERFRDFFTQTAIEIEPQPFLGAKKEKKPSIRERLNQVKEEQAAKNHPPQYTESEPDEDVGFALEEQKETKWKNDLLMREEEQTKEIQFPFSQKLKKEISIEKPQQLEEKTIQVQEPILKKSSSSKPQPMVSPKNHVQEVVELIGEEIEEFSFQLNEPIWDEPQEHEVLTESEEQPAEEKAAPELEFEQESEEDFTEDAPKKKVLGGFRWFGKEEDSDPEVQENAEQQENPEQSDEQGDSEEYTTKQETEEIQSTLLSMTAKMTVKAIVTALLAAVLIWLGMGAARLYPLPGIIDPSYEAMPFLVVNLILTLAAGVLCFRTIKEGLLGLFSKPSMDTMPALAMIAALIQNIVLIAQPKLYEPATFSVFSGIAVAGLCFNSLGKRIQDSVISKNFEMANSQLEHWAACTIQDRERVLDVANGLGEKDFHLVVSRPTAVVKDFLQQSFSERKSEKNAKKLSYLLLAIAVLCAVVGGIMAKSVLVGISVFAATLCLGSPFASTLLVAVPSLLMQKHTSRVGAVVPGWSAIEELGKTNMVLVGAKDLFPVGTIVLKGIKTFEKERIDLAILYATSILVEACDTMKEVFSGIIQGKTDILYPVESFTHEVGYGYSAWIDNERILVGTREMMIRHGLSAPSKEWEDQCTRNGERELLYLAVSGKLFAAFGLEYQADQSVQDVIHSLHSRGISLLIKSDDCCLTEELISKIYDIPLESIKILNEQERKTLGPELIFRPQSEGVMTHLGSFFSFVGGLRAAESAAAGERLATMVQTAAVIFSCLVALALTISGGLISLALPALLLYQASWTVLQLAMPLSKQY